MSIRFGDILQHNNPNFPISDITDIKGGLRSIATFSDASLLSEFTSGIGETEIPEKYKSGYSLLLERSTDSIYYFSGTSATNSSHWTRIGVGGNGTGVTNSVVKWIGTSTLGVSAINDDGNTITINGNLMVIGTTSTISTENLLVKDPIILLAGSQSGTPIFDAGLFINRGSSDTQAFIWDESEKEFKFITTTSGATVSTNVTIGTYSSVRTGVLSVGTGTQSNSRFIVSSSGGTVSLVVDEYGAVQLLTIPTTSVGSYKILTRNDITGEVEKITPYGTSVTNWYKENTTPPTTTPVATGSASIAIGNNAEALSNNTFVYGSFAGFEATGSDFSNLLGYYAGFQTSNSLNTNVIGNYAGFQSSNSNNSNFIGDHAGIQSSGSTNSNFIGFHAGAQSLNVKNSNFIGEAAGKGTNITDNSNFFGSYAGQGADYSDNSNFIGSSAGKDAIDAPHSNFLGNMAGRDASGASYSNFIGYGAGKYALNSHNSNFIGQAAGGDALNSSYSNFIGNNAGQDADEADNSNFIGERAGKGTRQANNSNFLGRGAGQIDNTTSVVYDGITYYLSAYQGGDNSNFIGANSGLNSVSNNSNFFGQNSGELTLFSNHSNFFGFYAGAGANSAAYSNFFGYAAGQEAYNAYNSNLFGYSAGKSFPGNVIAHNNIIIGTNITLPAATSNGINIGGIIFGQNTYGNTGGDPSIVAQTDGRIGINVVNPTNTLHVYGTQSAFRLDNGTQGPGYVLTSDVNGVTEWIDPNPQKTINVNTILDDTFNRAIVKVKTSATITIPSTLMTNFNCVFRTFTGVTASFIAGAGTTMDAPYGMTLSTYKMATLFKDGSTTTYILEGELTT